MNLARFLRPQLMDLDLRVDLVPRDEEEAAKESFKWRCKEQVIEKLAELFARSGEIRNPTKLKKDIIYREKQVTTGLGKGIALPHIRSFQARVLVVVFARSVEGVEYLSLDGKPAHIFFGLTAPPYDDSLFLDGFAWVARSFKEEFWLYEALMSAQDSGEVLSILHGLP
jgi:PTS system fructose-specific IIC component